MPGETLVWRTGEHHEHRRGCDGASGNNWLKNKQVLLWRRWHLFLPLFRSSSLLTREERIFCKPQTKLLLPRPNQTLFPKVLAGWGLSLGRCFLPCLHFQTNQDEEEFKDLNCLWNTLNTERALGREMDCG